MRLQPATLMQGQSLLENALLKKQMADAALAFAATHRGAVEKTMAAIEEKLSALCERI